jgi:hypothetical protein
MCGKPTNVKLYIQFINYVWQLLHVSALHCHLQGAFLVPSERCSCMLEAESTPGLQCSQNNYDNKDYNYPIGNFFFCPICWFRVLCVQLSVRVLSYCVLWIFPWWKIRRLRSGANPRSWVPEASTQTPRPPKPLIGNRARDLSASSAAPQPTAPTRAPNQEGGIRNGREVRIY